MDIRTIKRNNEQTKLLAKKGEEMISELKSYIPQVYPTDFIFKESNQSPHKLEVVFNGLRLIMRIAIQYNELSVTGFIKAYYLNYEHEPKEIDTGVAFEFDKLGNVTVFNVRPGPFKVLPSEYAEYFLCAVFGQLAGGSAAITLIP